MPAFEQETLVVRQSDGVYKGRVSASWNIAGNPNGGYLLSLVSSAIAEVTAHPDPVSFTAHYLRPGLPEQDCEISIEQIRQGRNLSTFRASLSQDGKSRVEVIAAYGDLAVPVGVDSVMTLPAPDMPPPEDCIPRTGDIQGIDLALTSKLDILLHPGQAMPGQAGSPEISGWIRFQDGRPPDTRALLMFCDTFPPSPFGALGVVGWVPTIELTVHVRRRPAPGWILGQFRTDDLVDGRMIESGSLWDSEGRLVAECRQLGLVLNRD